MLITILILLGIGGVTLVGLLAPSPLPASVPRWLLVIVYPTVVVVILLFIAAVRLQFRLSLLIGPKHLRPGDIIKDRDLNLSLLLQLQKDIFIKNITFEHCKFRGPCTVTVLGNIELTGCGFRSGQKIEDMIIEMNEVRQFGGIAAFVHCKFRYCEFHDISWLVNKIIADQLRKNTVVT